jgi:predicted methyltransferase
MNSTGFQFPHCKGLVLFCLFALSPGLALANESGMLGYELANAPGRSDEDKARDIQRKPDQVLTFLGLRSGDTALDVWASGGWYTEVLSVAVGPDGKVYSQNSPAVLQFRDGVYDKALMERLAGNRLENVVRLDEALGDTSLAPGSVDFALTALNFHDIYNRHGAEAATALLKSILDVLKPGGTLGVIDHVGVADADNTSLHRIDPQLARTTATNAGFIIEAESDILAHPEDDHSRIVFDPTLRGGTDRFILRLRKPE